MRPEFVKVVNWNMLMEFTKLCNYFYNYISSSLLKSVAGNLQSCVISCFVAKISSICSVSLVIICSVSLDTELNEVFPYSLYYI